MQESMWIWGGGFDPRRKENDETLMGIADERFLPDRRDVWIERSLKTKRRIEIRLRSRFCLQRALNNV
jgi:hypothetical protein